MLNKKEKIGGNLVRRYLRILERWQIIPVDVRLSDIADVMSCSPRYARSLLNRMHNIGWLSWESHPGRGAHGRLHCLISRTAVLSFKYRKLSETPTLCPEEPRARINYVGGEREVHIQFYRPLAPIIPSEHTARAERHLLFMVHAGLTRIGEGGQIEPDIAFRFTTHDSGYRWRFYLRDGLFWHDGEPVNPAELLQALIPHLQRPGLKHVINAQLISLRCIELTLSRPDAILAYRLSNPVYALAKPGAGETGLGWYQITSHTHSQLILERSLYCHRALPQLQRVVYNIDSHRPKDWKTLTLTLPEQEWGMCSHESNTSSGFMFMAFNERKGSVTDSQARMLRLIARDLAQLMLKNDSINPVPSFAHSTEENIPDNTILPSILRMGYFWTLDSEVWCKLFKKQLSRYGCKLILYPISAANWFLPESWEGQDISLSNMRFQDELWLSPEFRIRHSVMLNSFMPKEFQLRVMGILDKLGMDSNRYSRNIMRLFKLSIQKYWIVPLFSFRFRILAAKKIRGVSITSQGWPDFSQLWLADD